MGRKTIDIINDWPEPYKTSVGSSIEDIGMKARCYDINEVYRNITRRSRIDNNYAFRIIYNHEEDCGNTCNDYGYVPIF